MITLCVIPLNGYVMIASRNRHIYLHFFIFSKIRPCLQFKREQIWLEEEKNILWMSEMEDERREHSSSDGFFVIHSKSYLRRFRIIPWYMSFFLSKWRLTEETNLIRPTWTNETNINYKDILTSNFFNTKCFSLKTSLCASKSAT